MREHFGKAPLDPAPRRHTNAVESGQKKQELGIESAKGLSSAFGEEEKVPFERARARCLKVNPSKARGSDDPIPIVRLTMKGLSLKLLRLELVNPFVESIPKDPQVFSWQCRHEFVVGKGNAGLHQPDSEVRQLNVQKPHCQMHLP